MIGSLLGAPLRVLAISGAVRAVAGCAGDEKAPAGSAAGEDATAPPGADFAHVHGLGINPRDGALLIATHTGLFRATPGSPSAKRVGDSQQDVMGFTVVGPDRFLGSGHPDPRTGGPPNLGLIRSQSAGRDWQQVSLLGETDFHVLRAAGRVVYGFDGSSGLLFVSRDGGRAWQQRTPPAPLIDLAIDPRDDERVIAATPDGLFASPNGGEGWRPLDAQRIGLLAWSSREVLYLIGGDGAVVASTDRGRSWEERGTIGGQPAAFVADAGDLYAALADGTVTASADGGRSWTVRARP